jgi:hypothetical protein
MNDWNAPFETWLGSGKFDSKNREIGYIVGLNDNGTEFAAWVQNGRKIGYEFSDFGVPQRSKQFPNQQDAVDWAYKTAYERIANL